MTNVFIVGSVGIPASYGGFETFVENLTKRKVSKDIKYFVSCMGVDNKEFEYNDAHCFNIPLKKNSAFNRLLNVSRALKWVENYIKNKVNKEDNNIVYILGCRIGSLMPIHRHKLHTLGCKIVINPDGLEWKRNKWNALQKILVKLSERMFINNSDYLISDSIGIKEYIVNKYKKYNKDNIYYIPYGSDISLSTSGEKELEDYLSKFNTKPNDYYLIVSRFVPENNFYLVIKEFLKSNTTKKLLIISNVDKNKFYKKLEKELHFSKDNRIIFAGTLYNSELLKKVRENASVYIHGHSVGGTNPSLLEALGSTKINLLYNVVFNKEVGRDSCLYFSDKENELSSTIEYIEKNYGTLIEQLNPKKEIVDRYSWAKIIKDYENLFKELVSK